MTPQPMCPAASLIGDKDQPSCVCGVLELSNDGAHIAGWVARGQVQALFDGKRDQATVNLMCCGTDGAGGDCYYTQCAIWRAQREAEWADRHGPNALQDGLATRAPGIDPDLAEAVRLQVGLAGVA